MAGGIGRSVVELLAEEGARVEGVDLREAEGVQPCDVSDAASVATAVGAAADRLGARRAGQRGRRRPVPSLRAIRANTVCPGGVETDLPMGAAAEHAGADLDWGLLSETAGGRYGFMPPRDIADAV
ncbi:MAG: NAD(P)-dependent dehydrogenase, short-chain alcohol dehydrogenase family, partial [Marmoricola sp.]|nr:NAD(P)-dependent dehydrogenase, short-chain alcohol dehydrogenase family [Marmoricola sp.]